jgi:hypothetical protein
MALKVYRSDAPIQYKGCVIETREMNGYHDSDFYAIVWDHELNHPTQVTYHTTRGASEGWANVDATPEVLAKYEAYEKRRLEWRRIKSDLEDQLVVKKGDEVEVFRGRKHKGETGIIIWHGMDYYGNNKVGLATSDEKDEKGRYKHVSWLPYAYCKKLNHDEIQAKLDRHDFTKFMAEGGC